MSSDAEGNRDSRSRSPAARGESRSRSRSPRRGRSKSRSRSPVAKPNYVAQRPARDKRDNPEQCEVLGCFGLSYDTDDKRMHEVFGKFGDLSKVAIVLDRGTGRSRGFGFVTFKEVRDAADAMEALNGTTLDGKQIRVAFSTTKKPHDATPGQYMGNPADSIHYGRGGGNRGGGGGGSYGGGGGGGGGYDRRDDRRGGYEDRGGGYDRRDDRGGGRDYDRRDDRGGGYDRRDDRGGGRDYDRRDDRGGGRDYDRRDDRGGGRDDRDDRDGGRR